MMTSEQKLERIEDLLQERAGITAQILQLLEPEPTPEMEEEPQPKPTPGKKKRKQTTCSGCGKPGHTVTTCAKTKAKDAAIRESFADDEESVEEPGKLTEKQFDEMKELQKAGSLSTKIFATEHDLGLAEVNRAIHFRYYGDYAAA